MTTRVVKPLTECRLQRRVGKKKKTLRTRHVEVGGDFAVGQREPDEPQAHAESGRDVGQVVPLAWNAKTIRFFLIRQNGVSKVCGNAKTATESSKGISPPPI